MCAPTSQKGRAHGDTTPMILTPGCDLGFAQWRQSLPPLTEKTMTKKRQTRLPKGIKLLADGRYQIRATATDRRTGKRRDVVRTLPQGGTVGQALDALEALRRDLQTGTGRLTPSSIPSVKAWVGVWLKNCSREGSSLKGVMRQLRPLGETLGALSLEQLRKSDLEVLCAELEARWGVRTSRGAWSASLSCLKDGWAEYQIPPPIHRVKPPYPGVKPPPAGRSVGGEGLACITQALALEPAEVRCVLLFVAWTGARPSEVVSLHLDDLDFEVGEIRIRGTKTAAARRSVPLTEEMARAARTWLFERPHDRGPWLFPGRPKRGEAPLTHRSTHWLRQHLSRIGEATGVGHLTPYDLRRTLASELDRAGVQRVVTRSMLGHTANEITDVYSRPDAEQRRSALRLVVGGGCVSLAPQKSAEPVDIDIDGF